MATKNGRIEVPCLRVDQWLDTWDSVKFAPELHREKPEPYFVLFSMSARRLRVLADIKRRVATQARTADTGIQRRYDPERSEEIALFVRYGFPWSDLSLTKRNSGEYTDLRKPGWLPTAIVVSIRGAKDRRSGLQVPDEDRVDLAMDGGQGTLLLPSGFQDSRWKPTRFSPFEVIDGQHRLWAFENNLKDDIELPVVAFIDLDISWQAYLFWTINIKPKKINASLAYDLYPLLRTEDWLEKFEGHPVYRESRAQELTEAMWSHPASPWHRRINMLGEGRKGVTQAAWIRALLGSYIRYYKKNDKRLGGLFGAPLREHETVLPWTRPQQAAFLIFVWRSLRDAIANKSDGWAAELRDIEDDPGDALDQAFEGPFSLLNTDQGVRGLLAVTNDLCFVRAQELRLAEWLPKNVSGVGTDEVAIDESLNSLSDQPVHDFITSTAKTLAEFDWRTAGAPGLSEKDKSEKLAFRGSGGYPELRKRLLRDLRQGSDDIASAAKDVSARLGLAEDE